MPHCISIHVGFLFLYDPTFLNYNKQRTLIGRLVINPYIHPYDSPWYPDIKDAVEIPIRGTGINIVNSGEVLAIPSSTRDRRWDLAPRTNCVGAACMLDDPGTMTLIIMQTPIITKMSAASSTSDNSWELQIKTFKSDFSELHSIKGPSMMEGYLNKGYRCTQFFKAHYTEIYRTYMSRGEVMDDEVRESEYEDNTPELELLLSLDKGT